jgi:hypothetical protein
MTCLQAPFANCFSIHKFTSDTLPYRLQKERLAGHRKRAMRHLARRRAHGAAPGIRAARASTSRGPLLPFRFSFPFCVAPQFQCPYLLRVSTGRCWNSRSLSGPVIARTSEQKSSRAWALGENSQTSAESQEEAQALCWSPQWNRPSQLFSRPCVFMSVLPAVPSTSAPCL